MSYYTGGGAGSQASIYEAGAITIAVKVDSDGLQDQSNPGPSGSYFSRDGGGAMLNESSFSIVEKDLLFYIDDPESHSVHPAVGINKEKAMPLARSSLTNLNKIPGFDKTLKEIKDEFRMSDDTFSEFVVSQLKFLGVSRTPGVLLPWQGNERFHTEFACQVTGLMTLRAYEPMGQNDLVRFRAPTAAEFKSRIWDAGEGIESTKIPLLPTVSSQTSFASFGERIMKESMHDGLLTFFDHNVNENNFISLQTYVKYMLQCAASYGILFATKMIKYDVLGAPFAKLNAYGNGNFANINNTELRIRYNQPIRNDIYKNTAEKTLVTINPVTLSRATGGGRQGDPEYAAEWFPEEFAVVIGKLTGLLEPQTAEVNDSGRNEIYNRALTFANHVALEDNWETERNLMRMALQEYFEEVFSTTNSYNHDSITANRVLNVSSVETREFGNLPKRPGASMHATGFHLGKTNSTGENGVTTTTSKNLYGKMLNVQRGCLFNMLAGLKGLIEFERSTVIGRVVRAGDKDGTFDLILF